MWIRRKKVKEILKEKNKEIIKSKEDLNDAKKKLIFEKENTSWDEERRRRMQKASEDRIEKLKREYQKTIDLQSGTIQALEVRLKLLTPVIPVRIVE